MSERGPSPASTAKSGGRPPAGAGRRWGDLLPRILSALVMVALAAGTALAGGVIFLVFWLLAAVAVTWEWQRLIGMEGFTSRVVIGVAALAIAVMLAAAGLPLYGVAAVAAGMAGAALAGPGLRAMAALGVLYAGALVLSVSMLRVSVPDMAGLRAIFWLFAVVWGTDIFAYFGGRLIGGPKLWARLSPSKTWSGFLVGITAGALAGLAVAPIGSAPGAMLAVGLVAGALAQAGDFLESGIKRRYGVKDASHLIPGHGGVMDRLDGFIVAAVFACGLGGARSGLDAAGLGLFNWR